MAPLIPAGGAPRRTDGALPVSVPAARTASGPAPSRARDGRGPASGEQSGPPAYVPPVRRGRIRQYLYEHPVAMDGVVVFASSVLSIGAIIETADGSHWWQFALVVAEQLALMLRRKVPWSLLGGIAVADAVFLFATPSMGSTSAAVLFALYAVAVQVRTGWALGAAVAASLPVAVYFALVYRPTETLVEQSGPFIGLVGSVSVLLSNLVAVGVGIVVRGNRIHQAEIRAWAMRRAQFASIQERNRIAREMHDVVAHSLTVMVALSDGAARALERDPETARAVLGELSSTGRAALADMRRVLGVLRADAGAPTREPALGGLQALVDGFRAAGLPVILTQDGESLPDDAAFRLAVYRIIQESLTNVLRYARGVGRVDVLVARDGGTVRVRVENDGGTAPDGPEAHLGTGGGIAGMQERAAIFGGFLSAGPRSGGGWRVDAELHWNEGE
ncbi:histidine kinase [Sinomonas sp. ASV322]|uniref:sensor histidine kinase n=1 Tax=Sinomonas sp. ASV322 TaxID=3041920 RepID=UPI0027DB7684|nr:histidine kinase [Sinomonas sp. ASV322]MDQ4503950.1 histidine kinase [Sinomonas sp. ASV322]